MLDAPAAYDLRHILSFAEPVEEFNLVKIRGTVVSEPRLLPNGVKSLILRTEEKEGL